MYSNIIFLSMVVTEMMQMQNKNGLSESPWKIQLSILTFSVL